MKKCFLSGYVGQDPELRVSKTGKEFMTFSIGIRENKTTTLWVNLLTTSEKLIKTVMPYVKKGSHLNILGSLSNPNAYKDKEGQIRSTNVVYIIEMELLDKKGENNGYNNSSVEVYDLPESETQANLEDDIPF